MILQFFIAWFATRLHHHQNHVIAYLREENCILKAKRQGRRIHLTATERRLEVHEPRCAYCHGPEKLLGMPLEGDHILPEGAGGETALANLCLCCRPCNGYKWQRTYASDPQTGRRVRVFHPRQQRWSVHFAWSADGASLIGRTATGRATIALLRMNNDLIMDLRRLWVTLGLHPRDMEP